MLRAFLTQRTIDRGSEGDKAMHDDHNRGTLSAPLFFFLTETRLMGGGTFRTQVGVVAFPFLPSPFLIYYACKALEKLEKGLPLAFSFTFQCLANSCEKWEWCL